MVVVVLSLVGSSLIKLSNFFLAATNSVFTAWSFRAPAAVTSLEFKVATLASSSCASAFDASSFLSIISLAVCLAWANSSCILAISVLYAFTLLDVLPLVSANFKSSATLANAAFWSAVMASTNLVLASSKSAFFLLTLANSSATASGVAFSSSIIVWAAVSALVASAFALSYTALLAGVLPGVGSASLVNFAKSSFAFFKAVLSALSFNKSTALVNFSLTAATFSWAAVASALVALSPLSWTVLASCLAVSNSAWNCLIASLYALTLSGVFVSVSGNFKSSSTLAKSSFCSLVIASTNLVLASSKAAFLSLTLANASATSLGVALASLITVWASVSACFAAVLAWLYASLLAFVLPVVGSASLVNFAKSFLAAINSFLSAWSFKIATASTNLEFKVATLANTVSASAFEASFSFALFTISLASFLAFSKSSFILAISSLYFVTLAGVLPLVSANFKRSSTLANAFFCSSVIESTKASFAFSNSEFLLWTSVNAAVTASGVAFSSSIIFWASASACVADLLALSYASLLVWVLPVVGSASLVNFASSSLAAFKVVLSALSFNKAAASTSFTLTKAILTWASVASALVAFSFLLMTSSAVVLAAVKSAWILSIAAW